jgi:hypothetical protein
VPFKLWGGILASTWTMGTPGGRIIFPCGRPSWRIAPANGERRDKEAKKNTDFQGPDVVAIAEGLYRMIKVGGVVRVKLH